MIKEGKVIYALSDEEIIAFEIKTMHEYEDYKAHTRFYEQALKERIKG